MTKAVDQAGGQAVATTADRIREAAAGLVVDEGWTALTTRRVAARARVNNALVHYHFGSIGALRSEVARIAVREALAASVELIAGAPSLVDALSGVAEWSETLDPSDPSTTLLIEAIVRAPTEPDLAAVLTEELEGIRTVIGDHLSAEGADREHLAVALTALLDGLVLHRLLEPDLDVRGAAAAIGRLVEEDQR